MNATSLAKERGIQWSETASPTARDYTNLLTVRCGDISLGGTNVGNTSRPRLVTAFDKPVEIELERYVGVFRNRDVPGIIGQVGSILGKAGVNIAQMAVSRGDSNGDGEAVMAITVDSAVPQGAADEIRGIDGFTAGWFVDLGS